MAFRAFMICIMAVGAVLLGNGANAEPLPGGPHPPERAGAMVVNVYGNGNMIATDRSVMAVGNGTRPNANTGDVSSSGTLGIDTTGSALKSGASSPPTARPQEPNPKSLPFPISGNGQGTSISGYENHSVNVSGEDQIAVYDDSNLFVEHNGEVNANTGDTDSSGLNAVDVSGSKVGSGDHFEEGARSRSTPNGAEDDPNQQVTTIVTDEGESGATGKNALTIGADGYDDLGTGLQGKRNIVLYDDSNAVLGGTGKANAQIGDSDTSGTVVMDIDNSNIQAGNST